MKISTGRARARVLKLSVCLRVPWARSANSHPSPHPRDPDPDDPGGLGVSRCFQHFLQRAVCPSPRLTDEEEESSTASGHVAMGPIPAGSRVCLVGAGRQDSVGPPGWTPAGGLLAPGTRPRVPSPPHSPERPAPAGCPEDPGGRGG